MADKTPLEPNPTPIVVPRRKLTGMTRRDFLLYGAGTALGAAGFWTVLPEDTKARLLGHAQVRPPNPRVERFLDKVLTFDDDVAEALYSPNRLVPIYDKRLALSPTELRNNYDGQTPDDSYLADWGLKLAGLASGPPKTLRLADLQKFPIHDQVTRLCCVEGWSAIAWWGGLRFADLLQAYPPRPDARWAKIESSVNLDSDGNSDPYYVSLDLGTARHPQTLLATHQSGQPLNLDHGAPLRLIAPMKLGLKNIKAITSITYTVSEPADYWNERGYSKYDGL